MGPCRRGVGKDRSVIAYGVVVFSNLLVKQVHQITGLVDMLYRQMPDLSADLLYVHPMIGNCRMLHELTKGGPQNPKVALLPHILKHLHYCRLSDGPASWVFSSDSQEQSIPQSLESTAIFALFSTRLLENRRIDVALILRERSNCSV